MELKINVIELRSCIGKISWLFLCFWLVGCNSSSIEVSFYFWKSNVLESESTNELLIKTASPDLYVHFFDVNLEKKQHGKINAAYPHYPLRTLDKIYKHHNIIPVVFIVNAVLKETPIDELAKNIQKLVHQIAAHHHLPTPSEIQLDCDWNQSTQKAFFELVEKLNRNYRVSSTIRLHQIKYFEKTGVPPVHKGVLMLYNMGDLKNENENSILSLSTVKQYIDSKTTYPLTLDVALPAFSQTVIISSSGNVKLINSSRADDIKLDKNFVQVDDNLFRPLRDTLYHGFYINESFLLKTEMPEVDEIIESYKYLQKSKLKLSNKVLLYHLDDRQQSVVYLNDIIERL